MDLNSYTECHMVYDTIWNTYFFIALENTLIPDRK